MSDSKVTNQVQTNKLENLNLKGILKTIEGDLQTAQYFNSCGIFAKSEDERLFHLRKVVAVLDKIKTTIEELK